MSRLRRGTILRAALVVAALAGAGCTEGARTGTVHQAHLRYGPWWSYPTIYEGDLALGRPKVVLPAEAPLEEDEAE